MSKRYNRNGNCWEYRSGLEKILICGTVVILFIFIVLAVLLIVQLKKDFPQPDICSTATCLGDASQVIQRVDFTINPCDDFYKFSCGNLLKSARGDETLGPFFVIQEKSKRQIREMYSEPVQENDHKTVESVKKLYRACLNESEIENSGLWNIEDVLKLMGGWPVVEGVNWDESRFWWTDASFKLRKLGYFYSSFLEVTVDVDPKNENRFIFKVSVPNVERHGEYFHVRDRQGLMIDIASAFGAENERASIDMTETYDFMLNMRMQSYLRRNDGPHGRFTIAEYQQQYGFINWLELINNIVGPGVKLYRDDYVLFPPSQTLQKWFNFILQTPKRVQANYMLWKVIEDNIPYLPQLQNDHTIRSKIIRDAFGNVETRSDFCISQIRKKFIPSPIDILYVRKYLPVEKKNEVEEIIKNLKLQLMDLLEKATWLDVMDKQIVMTRIVGMREVIGAPGNYFDDEILNDLDIDLEDTDSTDFLSLLALVNRNHESWKYNQIYNTKYESRIARWNLQTTSVIGDYFREENVIYIPATILQDVIFDEERPKYLNYGSMGTLMGHHFVYVFGESVRIFDKDGNVTNGWSNIFESRTECLTKQAKKFNVTTMYATDLLIQQILGLKLSYGAYRQWTEYNKEGNPNSIEIGYTPNQLFWISTASYFCQPRNPLSDVFHSDKEQELLSFLVTGSLLNNQNFPKDFNCPTGSQMNPTDKCEVF